MARRSRQPFDRRSSRPGMFAAVRAADHRVGADGHRHVATLDELLAEPGRAVTVTRDELAIDCRHIDRLAADLRAALPTNEPSELRGATANQLLTASEAAARLGYTRVWLYRHAKELPFTVEQALA